MVEETQNRIAIATVLTNRLFYSINWFSIPPIFYLMALDLHTQVSGLGLISSTFLAGIGLFQVPGGILSSRFGPRKMCVTGMVILSASAVLCAFVSSIYLIAILRFFSGMGMALFFPPSIALMTSYSRLGRAGVVLGLNNAVASLGGGIGLFGWAIIGDSVGWRLSLALIGVLGLASTVSLLSLPPDAPMRDFRFRLPDLRRILFDRWLLLVGCVLLAYNIGNTLDATFVEVYLHDSLGLSAGLSGGIGSLVILAGLFTAPVAGHFHDRVVGRVKLVLTAAGLAIAVAVALPSLATPAAVAASAVIVGLASGIGYTFAFATAWNSSKARAQRAITLSWVNSVQLLFSFWAPYLFSFVVVGYGYQLAWMTGGLYTAVFIFPIVLWRGAPPVHAEVP